MLHFLLLGLTLTLKYFLFRSIKDKKDVRHTLMHYIAELEPKSLKSELNAVHVGARLNLADVRVAFNAVSAHVDALSTLLNHKEVPAHVVETLTPFYDACQIRYAFLTLTLSVTLS